MAGPVFGRPVGPSLLARHGRRGASPRCSAEGGGAHGRQSARSGQRRSDDGGQILEQLEDLVLSQVLISLSEKFVVAVLDLEWVAHI